MRALEGVTPPSTCAPHVISDILSCVIIDVISDFIPGGEAARPELVTSSVTPSVASSVTSHLPAPQQGATQAASAAPLPWRPRPPPSDAA